MRSMFLGLSLLFVLPNSAFGQIGLRGELVASGFDFPVFVTAPPNDERLFVVERAGRIRIIQGGSVLATPFLDISDRVSVVDTRGFFGLAFDPAYSTNGFFYVYYVTGQ